MKILVDRNIPHASEIFSKCGLIESYAAEDLCAPLVKDADAILVRTVSQVNRALLDGSNIRFVASSTSGTDHIDLEYLQSRNIGFISAAGTNAESVAEYLVAALLHLAIKYGVELTGKKLGIVGVGHIGSKVARKAEVLGMDVFLNDPPLQRATGNPKYLPLSDLYDCDFITLHTPLTKTGIDKTYHLVDEGFFKSLRRGTFIINSSRGAVIRTAAIKQALNEGRIKGTVLDVWENEPNIDLELIKQVDIATPHIAGYSIFGRVGGVMVVYEAMCRHFGITPDAQIDNFLPVQEKPSIMIDPSHANEQAAIHQIVQEIYSIASDDAEFREIIKKREGERSAYFRHLRRKYPVRWEFANVEVNLDPFVKELADKLIGLGFQVRIPE